MTDWWTALYDDLLADLLLDGDATEADQTADALVGLLHLAPGDRVFDQGCGTGRVALPLLQRGLRVFGIDGVPAYIERARRAAGDHPGATFAVGDIHHDGPPEPCDGAFSWWTCLGYHPTDAENRRPLARALAALRPGGRYALDTMNVASVLRRFRPVETHTLERPEGTVSLTRTSRFDLAAGVLHKEWAWTLPDGRILRRPSAVRAYLPHEWIRLMTEIGFQVEAAWGDLDRSPLTEDSPRCILVARRPA